jgi:hypothetical protein
MDSLELNGTSANLKKLLKRYAAMWSFRSIRDDLSKLKKAMLNMLSRLVEIEPDGTQKKKHRVALHRIQYEYGVSIASARASIELTVDPETIEKCIRGLMHLHRNEVSSTGVRRIVACSTLVPKQWLNTHLIRYLMTTLALEPRTGTGAAHKCRYYLMRSEPIDPGDKAVLDFLERLHEMFGFRFEKIEGDRLQDIEAVSKLCETGINSRN